MNLIIDIGNTRAKLAVFKKDSIVLKKKSKHKNILKKIKNIFSEFSIFNTIISSVHQKDEKLIEFIKENSNLIVLTHKTKVPFINHYKTPATLGVDRIALVSAAIKEYPNQNVLVIDAGTCVTYDFVSNKKEYYGGIISPGIKMRYKAMHHFTKKLPLLNPLLYKGEGNSTENAMHLGVLKGIIYEIEGIIREFQEKNNNLTIVLTGGDKKILSNLLKSSIFANPNFILLGLNYILNYNLDD